MNIITWTQYNKITKAKSQRRNIDFKLFKSKIADNGGSIGSIIANLHLKSSNLPLQCTLRLIAISGAISGATKKPVSGDGAVRRVAKKDAPNRKGTTNRKGATKEDEFLGALLAGLAAPLILNTLIKVLVAEPAGLVKD